MSICMRHSRSRFDGLGDYLSVGRGSSVDELLQFVEHGGGSKIAAGVVVVEGRLALRVPPFLEERTIEPGDRCFKRFVVSRHRREGGRKREGGKKTRQGKRRTGEGPGEDEAQKGRGAVRRRLADKTRRACVPCGGSQIRSSKPLFYERASRAQRQLIPKKRGGGGTRDGWRRPLLLLRRRPPLLPGSAGCRGACGIGG